ncbi:endonuclease III [Ligilactobacillus ceti]|nr:endonuclease III [Ligilactobacillus ceti]
MLNAQETTYAIEVMGKTYPEAIKSTLDADSDFHFLIAVILSAQTTDKAVNKLTPALFARYPDAKSLAQADVEYYLKSIGLYKNKAKYIVTCAKEIVTKFSGQVPQNKKDLMSLAGVGRKTANVVLSDRFNVPALAVDTHVSRVSKRLAMVPSDASVTQVETILMSKIPKNLWSAAHFRMIYWGRERCTARKPRCFDCPLLAMCMTGQKNMY